jgi:hypothetical protein
MKIVKHIRLSAWHEVDVPEISEATWNAYIHGTLGDFEKEAIEAILNKKIPANPLNWNESEIADEGFR